MEDETKFFRFLLYFSAALMVSVLCNNYSQDVSTTFCEKPILVRIIEALAPYIYGLSCEYDYAFHQSDSTLELAIDLVKQIFKLITRESEKSEELYICQLELGSYMKFQFSMKAYHCDTVVEEGADVFGIWLVLTGCILLASAMAEFFIRRAFSQFDSFDEELAEIRTQEEQREMRAQDRKSSEEAKERSEEKHDICDNADEDKLDEGTRID